MAAGNAARVDYTATGSPMNQASRSPAAASSNEAGDTRHLKLTDGAAPFWSSNFCRQTDANTGVSSVRRAGGALCRGH